MRFHNNFTFKTILHIFFSALQKIEKRKVSDGFLHLDNSLLRKMLVLFFFGKNLVWDCSKKAVLKVYVGFYGIGTLEK